MSGIKHTKLVDPSFILNVNNVNEDQESINQRFEELNNSMQQAQANNDSRFLEIQNRNQNAINQLNNQLQQANAEQQSMINNVLQQAQNNQQRISNLGNRLNEVNRKNQQNISKIRNDINSVKQDYNSKINDVKQQITTQNQKIKALDNKVDQNFVKTMKELEILENQLTKDYNQKINNLNSAIKKVNLDLRNELSQTKNDFFVKLNETKNDFKNRIDQLSNQIKQQEKVEERQAYALLLYAHQLISYLNTLNHKFFLPDEFKKITSKYKQIEEWFKTKTFQAVISSSDELKDKVVEVINNLRELEEKWLLSYNELDLNLSDLIAFYKSTDKLSLDLNVEILGTKSEGMVEAKVDFWTEGKLSKVKEQINSLIRELKSKNNNLSQTEIDQANSKIPEIKNKISELIEETKAKIISSQNRAAQLNKIAQAVTLQGYQLSDHTYDESDERKSIRAKFSDHLGNDIVVIISPTENDFSSNNVDIHFFETTNDETLYQSVTQSIYDSFKMSEINIAIPQSEKGYEEKASDMIELKDIEKFKVKS
jgi:DNA repair exonuclease SbcCD ATPase subunit